MNNIHRFPREESLHVKDEPNAFSMNDVYIGLEKLASGKKIEPKRMVLLCNWFGLSIVNQFMAKQILRQLSNGTKEIHVRFPREGRNNQND